MSDRNTACGLQGTGISCEKPFAGVCFDFAADDWLLPEYAAKVGQGAARSIHIGFSGVRSPAVKLLVKQYTAWRLGRVKPVTARAEWDSLLRWWVRYLESKRIEDPAYFGAKEMHLFSGWLQKKGVRREAAARIARRAVRLIETGQRLGWRVTKETVRLSDFWYVWEAPPEEAEAKAPETGDAPGVLFAAAPESGGQTRPIPDALYRQILKHAICNEKDIITKSGILVQSQTGLRISEVLSLREGCLVEDGNGGFLLGYESKKTQRAEPVTRFVPANALVCSAVAELAEATGHLRRQSGRSELFLVKNHGIRPASAANWNRGRLRGFLRRWEITVPGGGEYPLHSHQFRASYVRRRMLAGTGIETVRQQFGHASSEMTAQYVHIETDELAAFLSPYLGGKGGVFIG